MTGFGTDPIVAPLSPLSEVERLRAELARWEALPPCCYDGEGDEGRLCQMLVDLRIENERLRRELEQTSTDRARFRTGLRIISDGQSGAWGEIAHRHLHPASTDSRLGAGGSGPWENRCHLVRDKHPNPAAAGGWLNQTYAVQLFQHPTHPGVDHLCVKRHDNGTDIPWPDLQAIKDRLAPDGQLRWAIEAFPPRLAVVDNHNLRHVWTMPAGWTPPVDLRDVRT